MNDSSNRRARRRAAAGSLLVCLCLALLVVATGSAHAQFREMMRVERAISAWDYEQAAVALAELQSAYPDAPETEFAAGHLLYHQGDYDAAVASLRSAASRANGRLAMRVEQVLPLVESTAEVVDGYDTYTSADGHFVFRFHPRDRALIAPAARTLERAYYAIGYSVGYWPQEPVRVEIYPRARFLADVSSLPAEAVETTSTIGLCKYNKLMFVSPRGTVRGYNWRDTLAHEYVHYVISRMTANRVPVWLHEGLAKFLESRWRDTWDLGLEPSREDLLARRLNDGDFITFDEMSPSIALLPSQEDAALAYAEVYTVLEYFTQRHEHDAIRALLEAIAAGETTEAAFALVAQESWESFEANWMDWLREERPRQELPGQFEEEILLLGEAGQEDDVGDFAGVDSPEARDYLHLGELLRARGHTAAALQEYTRAEALLGPYHPMVQNGKASTLLEQNRPEEALEALADVTRWYPGYYYSYLNRAEALNQLQRYEEALHEADEALGFNPFDPRVYEVQAVALRGLGRPDDARRAEELAQSVAPPGYEPR